MTEPREDRIVAEGVHKAFGENEVLKGVSFSVAQGSATAIIGPSGSGKTTLLRALNALDVPDAGVIRVGEVEIDFSNYQAVNGIQVPFHVQKLISNGLVLDLVMSSAVLNSGLSDSLFAVQ